MSEEVDNILKAFDIINQILLDRGSGVTTHDKELEELKNLIDTHGLKNLIHPYYQVSLLKYFLVNIAMKKGLDISCYQVVIAVFKIYKGDFDLFDFSFNQEYMYSSIAMFIVSADNEFLLKYLLSEKLIRPEAFVIYKKEKLNLKYVIDNNISMSLAKKRKYKEMLSIPHKEIVDVEAQCIWIQGGSKRCFFSKFINFIRSLF